MAFTKVHAKILAGILGGEDLAAFRFICGQSEKAADATQDSISHLAALELIRIDTAGGKVLALLTAKGKKVAEFV
jgi:hypothetical protein